MQRLSIIFFTLIITFFLLSNAFAASKKTPLKLHPDTSKIEVKHFNKQALDKYKADKDFNYNGEAIGKPSLWEVFWSWLWHKISGLFNRIPYSGDILEYLFIGLSVAFLAYIIFKSLGIDPIRLWRGEAKKVNIPYSESLENIHEINFDEEIERAVAQHNYRIAVRLLYLRCLKQLSDKDLIKWQIDKTNSAYLYELTNPEQVQTFGLLTRQFEYVWYGNFSINKQAFTNIDLLFQNFKKQLP